MASNYRKLRVDDFAAIIGTTNNDIPETCAKWIDNFDLSFRVLDGEEKDRVVLEVLKRIESGQFSVSGGKRKQDWETGWQENLNHFQRSHYDLEELIPKFIRPTPLIRFQQQYAETQNLKFEWQFFQVYRYGLFYKFFQPVESIYEFGCGPGYNFVALNELYPEKYLYGLDWAQSAVDLVNILARTHHLNLKGYPFDFFNPDENVKLDSNSAVLTICALEQVGRDFETFLQYLLKQQPAICVHMEPIYEWYEEDNLLDYVAMKYHTMRGYLQGFYPRLLELESEGRIQIRDRRRSFFGSLFHEGYSFVVWKPVVG